MNTPSYAVEKKPTEIYPRFRSVVAINNRRTKRDPSPDYLYTRQLCQFVTLYNRIGDKRLEEERRKNSEVDNPEGEEP